MPPPRRSLLLLVLVALVVRCTCDELDDLRALDRKERVLRTHMSTKTSYPAPSRAEIQAETQQLLAVHGTCRPVQLNYVVRHGTRFPTIKDITRISATHEKLLLTAPRPLPDTLRYWLLDWQNPYDHSRAGWLAEAGAGEQISMGRRLRERFADAFHGHFSSDKFVFEHTYKPRTLQSAMGFSYGFFGNVQPVHFATDPIGQDHELRFFDNCPLFDKSVDRNKSATIEHAKYRQSAQMKRNLATFRRLAGDDTHQLTQKDLEAAYAACAFDVAVRVRFSEWCALFDKDALLSMDYFQDLKHFYKKGHGNAIAFEIAAPLLQNVHQTMLSRVNGDSDIQGHFRFAHAETILPLASLLNLSYFDRHANDRDGHFLAETPLEVAKQRSFKGSTLAPFSGNIGFVLYECQDSQFYVQTLMHERTVRFPKCGNALLCPFRKFESIFSEWIHEYDFFSECALT